MVETAARRRSQYKYNQKPEQVLRREARNRARYKMESEGKVHKGDGKDVDHKNGNPNDNKSSNLKVTTPSKNRSYARTKGAHKKNPRS